MRMPPTSADLRIYPILTGNLKLLQGVRPDNIKSKNQITEVDYGTFLNMVESKEVSRVELNGDSIYFVDTDKEEPKYYATTTFDDPELVNRLEDAGCEFGRVAEKEIHLCPSGKAMPRSMWNLQPEILNQTK